jgi:CheY-like chemotaxis protein
VRRILVIDDEPLVALMIRRTLEPDHEVTVLHSGRAALLLFEQGARFDAIVTDLQMPDGDGAWLHGELARLDAAQARRTASSRDPACGGSSSPSAPKS